MDTELEITGNNLLNVVNWLKAGHIVCLHNSYKNDQYYYSSETIESVSTQELIYVNLSNWASLLDEDEWPYFIKDSGFVSYTSTHILPVKEHHFDLP